MRFLLDTDWVVSFLNGKPHTVTLVTKLLAGGTAISAVSYGEAFEGLLGTPDEDARMSAFDEFASLVNVINVGVGIARQFARIRQDLRSRGLLIPDNDIWIAATALEHGLTLVTRDTHFQRVPDVTLFADREP